MLSHVRNGSMRGFVTLTAPVVFHGGNDPNIGVFGIEGSKPGASAVSTLLSHRLDIQYFDNQLHCYNSTDTMTQHSVHNALIVLGVIVVIKDW